MKPASLQSNKQPEDGRRLWLLVLTTRDSAGDTAAIASVFSGRGIQIDSFIGFGSVHGEEGKHEGRIMLSFYAFEERCQSLCRVLESLEAVKTVRCLNEEIPITELMTQSESIKNLLSTL